jgi:crossover junction endodeoxyribonuclease RusA
MPIATRLLLAVHVPGRAVPQGSVIPFNTPDGKARTTYRGGVKEYRLRLAQALTAARHTTGTERHDGPARVLITVQLVRPQTHYRTGRNAHLLRDNAPTHPAGRNSGDSDKYARLVLDVCTDAAVWRDDSQAVQLLVEKTRAADAGITGRILALEDVIP